MEMQKNKEELISVVMPTYNCNLRYLRQAIDSILNQSHKNLEFVIVDDSTDEETIKFLEDIAADDGRIKYIHNKKKKGYIRSLNMALTLVNGEYIAKMDADDISEPDRLKVMLNFLKNNETVGILGSAVRKIGPDNEDLGIRCYPETLNKIRKHILIWNPIAHPTIMVRKQVFEKIGMYEETIEVDDYEFWFRALKNKIEIVNLNAPLLRYRISSVQNHFRRGRHWGKNLIVKLKYFDWNHPLYSVAGILLVMSVLLIPSFIERYLYKKFNSLR